MGFLDWLFGARNRGDQGQDVNTELTHWRIAEIKGDSGSVVVARIRVRRPELADLEQYTTAVSVVWPIVGDGLSPEMTAAMNQFEVSMEDCAGFSYLIQVRTGLGERNWLYYTSDGDRFATAIRSRLASHGWPLTIEIKEDPSWSEWRVLAERISGTTISH